MKRIKLLFITIITTSTLGYSQSSNQATSAVQINDIALKMQCSATGIGIGRDSVESKKIANENMNKALKTARRKGKSSFTNKNGSGCSNCVKYK